MILSQALSMAVARNSSGVAFKFLNKEIRFSDLLASIARMSYLLQKEIKSQQRVAFIGSNSPAMFVSFVALSNTRSVFIPIDPSLSDEGILEWIYDTAPTQILVTSDYVQRIQDLVRRRRVNLAVIDIERKTGGEYSTTFVPPADQVPKEQDPILLLRTAGTAGQKRYALFSHEQVKAAVSGLKKFYKITNSDVFFTQQSWSHPFAFVHGLLFPAFNGNTSLVHLGYEGTELLDFISKYKVTQLVDSAYALHRLLIFCLSAKRPLIGMKSAVVGMGDISSQLRKAFGLMKIGVSHCTGLTENLWSTSMSDPSDPDGNLGELPISGIKIKAIDMNGDTIEEPNGREGQLGVSGPTVMLRYDARDEKEWKSQTQATLRGTWLYTGDIYKFEGAKDAIHLKFIKRKDGFQPKFAPRDVFDPAVIENTLSRIEGLKEKSVFQDGGKIYCIVVPESETFTMSEFEILNEIKPALTPKNYPAKVFIRSEIPRLEDGSLDVDEIMGRKQEKAAA